MSSSRKRAQEEAEAAAKKPKGNEDSSAAVFVRDLLHILFILKDYVILILLTRVESPANKLLHLEEDCGEN